MTEFLGVEIPMSPRVMLPAIVAATAALAFLINHVVLWAIRGIIQRTSTEIDDRIFRLLEKYLFPLLTVGGLLVTGRLPDRPLPAAEFLKRGQRPR